MNDRFADLQNDLLRCNKCGSCASVCPTYGVLRRETTSARGRVTLVAAYLAGEIEADAELESLLYTCLSCHQCANTCPNGVRADRLVLAARAEMAEGNGSSMPRRAIFHGLLPYPERLDAALWPLRVYQASGLRTAVERANLASRLPGAMSMYGQMVPPAPVRPAMKPLAGLSPARGPARGRVGYFLGCAQNLLYPEAAKATVALLNLAGFDVVTPPDLVCCGMPAVAYGEVGAARDLAGRNVAAFAREGVDAIISDCASCGSFLKEYGQILAREEGSAKQAEWLSANVADISQFLAAEPPQGERKALAERRVTYHDPCHLAHAQGIKRPPRELIKAVPGVTLIEMRTPGACCGGAGSYCLTHPEVSTAILDKRIGEAVDTEAEVVATGCPACRMQLEYGLRRAKSTARVRHTVEVLAAAFGV